MSWLTEVRQALQGLEVNSVEMSDAVVVKFEQAWFWMFSDRSVELSSSHFGDAPKSSDTENETMKTIWSRLDRRIWRAEA